MANGLSIMALEGMADGLSLMAPGGMADGLSPIVRASLATNRNSTASVARVFRLGTFFSGRYQGHSLQRTGSSGVKRFEAVV